MHLTTTLFRERVSAGEDGEEVVRREPMNFCAIQPQLREGIDTVTPVVPGEEMALDLQCFTMAHWVPSGQRLSLEISTSTPHHASFGSTDPNITVFTGPEATAYDLPEVPRFKLADDVPLWENDAGSDPVPAGPAQSGIEGEVTVLAPGAGVIVEPVTAAALEFDSEEGYDNAAFEAVATPSSPPADIDLYLQRQTEDGDWEDVTAAETGDTEREVLTAGRLEPGPYRLVVHTWVGGPQDVHLKLTFLNGAGEPGEGPGGSASVGTAQIVTGEPHGLIQP
jgi:hypothetical protein